MPVALSNDSPGIATEATQLGTLTTQQMTAAATAEAAFYALLTARNMPFINPGDPPND